LQMAICNLSGAQFRLQMAICNLSGAQFRLQMAICNLSGAQFRLQMAICNLSGAQFSAPDRYTMMNLSVYLSGAENSFVETPRTFCGVCQLVFRQLARTYIYTDRFVIRRNATNFFWRVSTSLSSISTNIYIYR